MRVRSGGTKEPSTAWPEAQADVLADASAHLDADSGYWPHHEDPKRFAEVVGRFLLD